MQQTASPNCSTPKKEHTGFSPTPGTLCATVVTVKYQPVLVASSRPPTTWRNSWASMNLKGQTTTTTNTTKQGLNVQLQSWWLPQWQTLVLPMFASQDQECLLPQGLRTVILGSKIPVVNCVCCSGHAEVSIHVPQIQKCDHGDHNSQLYKCSLCMTYGMVLPCPVLLRMSLQAACQTPTLSEHITEAGKFLLCNSWYRNYSCWWLKSRSPLYLSTGPQKRSHLSTRALEKNKPLL